MLSDQEQRALEELERRYATEASEPVRSSRPVRRSSRPPGFGVVLVLGCLSAALVFTGVPVAGLAVALATAIGWLFWRLWSHRADDRSVLVMPKTGADQGRTEPAGRVGEWIRRYLKWLAEAG